MGGHDALLLREPTVQLGVQVGRQGLLFVVVQGQRYLGGFFLLVGQVGLLLLFLLPSLFLFFLLTLHFVYVLFEQQQVLLGVLHFSLS